MYKYMFYILCFVCVIFADDNVRQAELLEAQSGSYIRIAENNVRLAKIYEKRGDEYISQAQEYRKRAFENLQNAQDALQKAIEIRKQIVSSTKEKLQGIHSQKPNHISIGSWNIQNFGESKMAKIVPYKNKEYTIPEVVADILLEAKFDVVAIQEIEGDNLETIERVVEILNMHVGEETYRLTYPEKLGVSSNTAEYLPIVYNNKLLKLKTQGMLKDLDMQRPPHYALFEARNSQFNAPAQGKSNFDFCIVSVHMAPKGSGDADIPRRNDFKLIPKIFRFLNKKFSTEDIIVAGDFNCDPNRGGIDGELWAKTRKKKIVVHPITLRGERTIAKDTMTYGKRVNDNMIWMENSEEDFAGIKEVYEYDKLHFVDADGKIDKTSARMISDHLPVWAKFYTGQDSR